MTTAVDVVRYIKSQIHLYGDVQTQKLVYYSQAWSLVWEGRGLFGEDIEAWALGPVTPSLRHKVIEADADALSDHDRQIVDSVLAHYGSMTGAALSQLTHAEEPWKRARHDLPAGAWSDEVISREDIRRFHTRQSLLGEGPVRSVNAVEAKTDEVLAAAAEGRDRWKGALELLAQ